MRSKHFASLLCILTAVLMTAGCASSGENAGAAVRRRESSAESSSEEKSGDIQISSSSITSPAGFDTWFSVSKYSAAKKDYYSVPIRVTSVIRGKDAANKVRKLMENDPALTYRKPEKGYEWVVVGYDMFLDDFPVDECGADTSVQSFLMGKDGGEIEYSGSLYSDVTVNFTDGKYYYEGVCSGETAFILPAGYKDYLLSFGEYGESAGYFSETA